VTVPELRSVLGWLSRQAGRGVSVRTVRLGDRPSAGRRDKVEPGAMDPACRLLRGKRGQLQPGPALGRHAGHQPVQPGPLPYSSTRLIAFSRGRGPRGRGRWCPQISPPRPPRRCLAGNRPRLS
jgi:hypothetical protein